LPKFTVVVAWIHRHWPQLGFLKQLTSPGSALGKNPQSVFQSGTLTDT
jgi:hypothetical protein